jgi:hypothetical protein
VPILVIIILLLSCKKLEDTIKSNPYSSANQKLKENFSKTKIINIELDSKELINIHEDKVTSISSYSVSNDSSLFFVYPFSGINVNNKYLITDNKLNCLMLANDNMIIRSLGRRGAAPNEFNQPTNIAFNGSKIFIQDHGNGRIQIFNKELNYITSLPAVFIPFTGTISANNKNLFITTGISDTTLVNVYHIEDNNIRFLNSFVPRLVKLNVQPIAMNNITFDVDKRGMFYMSYTALPYILVYDSTLQAVYTIKFTGKETEQIYNDEIKNDFRVKTFIKDIKVTEEGKLIYVLIKSKLLILEKRLDSYYLLKAFSLYHNPEKIILTKNKIIFIDSNKAHVFILNNNISL